MPSTAINTKQIDLRYLVLATGVTAIGGFLFGYDTAVINGANTYLKAHLHLDPAQEGLAGASAILGCIPGAMLAGSLSDRFGRRRILILCAVLFAVSGILSALPRTFAEFLLARFISGLGIGASSMICPVYIAEISPEKWRGRLGTLFQLGIVTGIFLTLFINRVVQGLGDDAWNAAVGWRWMLGLEAVPAIGFIFLLLFVPESPRWLAQRGRFLEAEAILAKVGGVVHAAQEMQAICASLTQQEGGWRELGHAALRRPLLIAVVLMACSQFCGINAIMYYSTKIFATADGNQNAAFNSSVWVGLINLLFTFVAISLVDKAGRRPLLLIGTAVQTLSLLLVGWVFFTHQTGALLLWCVAGFIGAFSMAMGPISWLLCSEVFPNKVRGRAMSLAALTVWVACYLVAQTFPMLNDHPSIGPAVTFWIYAGVSLFSFCFVVLLVPETKGRTLEQIERLWSQPHRGGGS